jgi:peptidyl-tRNA hydrolase, PTH2 family
VSETKQVIVIRKDLRMRTGKACAQAAHASWATLLNMGHIHEPTKVLSIPLTSCMMDWFKVRFTKICVYVESEEALLEVYESARAKGLPCSLIRDAGLTEFGGVPTYTCVGIGPALAKDIDAITGQLPLL